MNARSRWGSRAILGFAWLGVFSILYTAGEFLGIWPGLPPGAFRDLDLAVGALGVTALAVSLLAGRRHASS